MRVRRIVHVDHNVGEKRATYILACGHAVERKYQSTKVIANCYECDVEPLPRTHEDDVALALEMFRGE